MRQIVAVRDSVRWAVHNLGVVQNVLEDYVFRAGNPECWPERDWTSANFLCRDVLMEQINISYSNAFKLAALAQWDMNLRIERLVRAVSFEREIDDVFDLATDPVFVSSIESCTVHVWMKQVEFFVADFDDQRSPKTFQDLRLRDQARLLYRLSDALSHIGGRPDGGDKGDLETGEGSVRNHYTRNCVAILSKWRNQLAPMDSEVMEHVIRWVHAAGAPRGQGANQRLHPVLDPVADRLTIRDIALTALENEWARAA